MAFDASEKEVDNLRKEVISNPDPNHVTKIASNVQEDYIEQDSAIIGGITTLEGIQSTKTRRPLSASADYVVNNANLQTLGESYPSWKYGSAYFAIVDGIEIGIIDISEFEEFKFSEEVINSSYKKKHDGNSLVISQPDQNVASKFNRVANSPVDKDSDYLDLKSHIHWYEHENIEYDNLASILDCQVQPGVKDVLENLKASENNLTEEDSEMFQEGMRKLENALR